MSHTTAKFQPKATRAMVLLARTGYAARGIVYLIVAFFAVKGAVGAGSNVSTKGAVEQVLGEPYGQAMMWCIVVGLIGYALWRMVQAVADTDNHGTNLKGVVGLVSSWDVPASGGSDAGQDVLSRVLEFEKSPLLVYAIALIPLGVGIAHLVKAWSAGFERYFECPERVMRWVRPVSQAGLRRVALCF